MTNQTSVPWGGSSAGGAANSGWGSSYKGTPGTFGTDSQPLSPVYIDNMPLEALQQALQDNQDTALGGRQVVGGRFWASADRYPHDPQVDVLEVDLATWRLLNHISLEIAHFPHVMWIQYWDIKKNTWNYAQNPQQRMVQISVLDSQPTRIDFPSVQPGYTHPQHNGPNHWLHQEIDLLPVTTSKLRFLFYRGVPESSLSAYPVNLTGKIAAYSLAARNIIISYGVADRRQIPPAAPSLVYVNETEAFTSTTDILGSAASYYLRADSANGMREGGYWKCEPQPVPNAVVNLFVDARTGNGEPQVIDRFYIEPLYSGPTVNLYYSNDELTGDFAATNDTLPVEAVVEHGDLGLGYDSANGVAFPDSIGFLDIDNTVLDWRPSLPWWFAITLVPSFSSANPQGRPIVDFGPITLTVDAGIFTLTVGAQSLSLPISFVAGQPLTLVCGADGDTVMLAQATATSDTLAEVSTDQAGDLPDVPTLRFGGSQGIDPGHAWYTLRAFVLKQEAYVDGGPRFATDPTDYNLYDWTNPRDQDTTVNALLRYDPSFMSKGTSGPNPNGWVGGYGNRYGLLVWTPVQRDYKLRKGYFNLPPTRAKFFKFEFTDLTPEPYNTVVPISRKVQVFPTAVVQTSQPSAQAGTAANSASAGTAVNQSLGPLLWYADQAAGGPPSTGGTRTGFSATEASYSSDPSVNAALRGNNYLWGFQPITAPVVSPPRFATITQHYYETIDVKQSTKVAYFVGLKALQMIRLDYAVEDDTEQYLDLFHDLTNVNDPGDWTWSPNDLSTPGDADPLEVFEAVSNVLPSSRNVIGVQFATQQTAARQLLTDPDFTDISLGSWMAVGDAARPVFDPTYSTNIGTTVRVQRGAQATLWSDIESMGEWDEILDIDGNIPTFGELEGATDTAGWGGIASAGAYQPSPSGRLYAAARVIAPNGVTAPLLVEIISEDGTILAESEVTPAAGRVTEWYAGFTIGEGGPIANQTFGDIEASGATFSALENSTWRDLGYDPTSLPQSVRVQIVQREPTNDVWNVDTLSLYDDPIVWSFSRDAGATWWPVYDIRNNPHGVFMWPVDITELMAQPDQQPVKNQLMWRVRGYGSDLHINALNIRPWYGGLMSAISHRESIQSGGPNISPQDDYAPIDVDPYFKSWDKPVPQDWWFNYRQWLTQQHTEPTAADQNVLAPEVASNDQQGPPVSPMAGDQSEAPQ